MSERVLRSEVQADIIQNSRTSISIKLSLREEVDADIPEILIQYVLLKAASAQILDVLSRYEAHLNTKGFSGKLFLTQVAASIRAKFNAPGGPNANE